MPQGRALARLKGLPVVAVAWAAHACTDTAAREVIVGTAAGTLFHLELHAAERTERLFKQLFELGAAQDKLQALHLEVKGGGGGGGAAEAADGQGPRRYTLLAVTATRLFVFTGGSLAALFLPAVTVRAPAAGGFSECCVRCFGVRGYSLLSVACIVSAGRRESRMSDINTTTHQRHYVVKCLPSTALFKTKKT